MRKLLDDAVSLVCLRLAQVSDMRVNYTVGGLDDDTLAPYAQDPMGAWAEWFRQATEPVKVGGSMLARRYVGGMWGEGRRTHLQPPEPQVRAVQGDGSSREATLQRCQHQQ
jgi:hypothetical protein